jgi:hypothetical protein
MTHLYGVNNYTYARYCAVTDLFKKLPELDPDPEPDPDLVVKLQDPAKRSGSDRIRIRKTATDHHENHLV